MEMTDKIWQYMKEYEMLPDNGNLVVGVSGGADSVCLLYVLVQLRDSKRAGDLRLTAVHVNHGLRSEAGEDAAFVEQLCAKWQVAFVLAEEDVELLAQKEQISCEEAGRMARYRIFAEELERMDGAGHGRGCIAVAHNSDDRAETLLFHLFRGTGLTGMGSIRPVRENEDGSRIIRPLLSCSRSDIEAFLKKEGLSWREDRTNGEDLYTRNRIRNRILPYAEAHICARAKAHLAREAELLANTADFVAAKTGEALGRCAEDVPEDRERWFDVEAFGAEEPFLQEQMIRMSLAHLGCGRDLTAAHVEAVKRLFAPSCISGRKVELPLLGISARRQFGQVLLKTMPGGNKKAAGVGKGLEVSLPLTPGSIWVPGLGEVHVRLLPVSHDGDFAAFLKNIPEKKYTKWLDYDKILKSAIFRTRRSGDYLTINDALGKKSLKRYMIEEKIPAEERDAMMLLVDGAHVIWVPGHRISAAYKVTAGTENILELRCREN